jgi:hypothetical protein
MDAESVVVAQYGEIKLAPLGSTPPADVTTDWDTAWVDLGYATQDGITLSKTVQTQDIYAWQSLTPLRRLITTGEFNLAFTAMETSTKVLETWFGATKTGNKYSIPKDPVQPETMLGVEWVDGTDKYRLVIHKAALGTFGDIPINRQGAVQYAMTFGALPYQSLTELAFLLEPAVTPLEAAGAGAGATGK